MRYVAAMVAELSPDAIALGFALQVLVTWALFAWGGWVARRRGGGRFWRFARWTPWLSFGLLATGAVLGVVQLERAFASLKTVQSSDKATVLAERISAAMKVSAPFYLLGYGLLFFGLVAFAVGSVRSPRAAP